MIAPRLAAPVAAALVLLAAGCGGGKDASTSAGTGPAASPPQLRSIAQLRAAFDSSAGAPTLVVLISPT